MSDARLNGPDVPLEDKLRELSGSQADADQVAYVRSDEVDRLGELTDTEIYEGELEAGVNDDLPGESDEENMESLVASELRAGETDDPAVAAEEGMTYVPPTDPPVVPDDDDPQGAQIAAGFGSTSEAEPYDLDHRNEVVATSDEMEARVRDALRADAATSRYANSLAIGQREGTIGVRGVVDEVSDTDAVLEVISRVEGVDHVLDELDVRALEG